MKENLKISTSLASLARLGVAGVCLGTAALTTWAQSSSSQSNTTANPRAQERASDRAQERASDRSALNRGANTTASAQMSRQDRRFVDKFTEMSHREMALAQLGAERATNPELKSYAQRLLREHATMHSDFMTVAAGGTLPTDSGALAGATSESQAAMSRDATTTRDADRVRDRDYDRTGMDRSSATVPARDESGRNVSQTDRTTSSGSLGAPSSPMATTSATGGRQDRHVRNLMEKKQGKDFDEAFVKRMVKEHDEGVEMLEDLVKDDDRNPQLRAFANKHLPIMREHLSQAKRLEDAID
jgi:predicted outer membrane protein